MGFAEPSVVNRWLRGPQILPLRSGQSSVCGFLLRKAAHAFPPSTLPRPDPSPASRRAHQDQIGDPVLDKGTLRTRLPRCKRKLATEGVGVMVVVTVAVMMLRKSRTGKEQDHGKQQSLFHVHMIATKGRCQGLVRLNFLDHPGSRSTKGKGSLTYRISAEPRT
jgi:hypothetical protein